MFIYIKYNHALIISRRRLKKNLYTERETTKEKQCKDLNLGRLVSCSPYAGCSCNNLLSSEYYSHFLLTELYHCQNQPSVSEKVKALSIKLIRILLQISIFSSFGHLIVALFVSRMLFREAYLVKAPTCKVQYNQITSLPNIFAFFFSHGDGK